MSVWLRLTLVVLAIVPTEKEQELMNSINK